MGQHVRMEIGLLVKSLMAPFDVAGKRLLACVDSQMSLKVKIEGKFLATQITVIRFLALRKLTKVRSYSMN
jgi:hypothetical protein